MRISRHLNRLRYFCADAWDEWRHSPGVNATALATLASVLFLAGLVTLVLSNVDRNVQRLGEQIRVAVYLRDDVTEEVRRDLEERLQGVDGVSRVEYVDKNEALLRYRSWAAGTAELINELQSNPLPASFEVYLNPDPGASDKAGTIATLLADGPGVEDVRFNRDWLQRLESLLDLARIGGIGLAVLVFAAVVLVMASVLRLAVHARRDEIEIMLLVGATPGFIRGPFLVAGLGHGLIGSLLALLIVEGTRRAVLGFAGSGSLLLDLVAGEPLSRGLSGLLVLVGLVVSLASYHFAVRQSV